jgi:aconitate hydratase 2/2-methylisocitrate dehydratase
LVVAAPTYNIIDELKAEGDWELLEKYSGFEFNDNAPKGEARTEYENMMYLERPGCNLCMGNQEKQLKRRYCFSNFYPSFPGKSSRRF